MPLARRRALVLGATLLSSGCLGTGPSTGAETDRPTDRPTDVTTETTSSSPTTADDRSGTDGRCQAGVQVRTSAFDPADDLLLALGETERTIVVEAAENGHADHRTYGEHPLETGVFVTHGDAFYRTRATVTATERVPAFPMDVEWERGQAAPADATVVPFEELPSVDREALRVAVFDPDHGEELPREGLTVREFPAPYPGGGDDSRIVGTETWVRWRDRTFRVTVAAEAETTQERRTVRYTLERVGATADTFRQFVTDQYLVRLDDLPDAGRAIVEDALVRGYEECKPQSAALTALRERLSGVERLPDPHEDSWYAALGGRRFRLEIGGWVH
ncbi:hypothetical protein [Salinigranum salinum]|uniref:hypothetical protein n=1 Tax=Salinigranum salinum TaxID=1364937 RepID=UPI0012607351|nr:hypothetical protein [Salinigranum salinum]